MTPVISWRNRASDKIALFLLNGGQLVLVMMALNFDAPHEQALVVLGLALLSLFAWLLALRRWRLVDNTPTSRISSAAQGYVELNGTGKPLAGLPLLAPIRGTPCLWYHLLVETKDNDGDWHEKRRLTSDASLILEDGSGQCLIDPEGADVSTAHRDTWEENGERYTLSVLLSGDTLYALGQFSTARTPSGANLRQEELKQLLSDWKADPTQLRKRFDLDGNGDISEAEWSLARSAAQREIEARHREQALQPDLHQLHYPADGRPFLLSNRGQKHLSRRYLFLAWGHLALLIGAIIAAFRLETLGTLFP